MRDYRDLVRRQLELEDESRALGASRYHSRLLPWRTEAGSIDEEANLPPGKQILKTCVEPVAEAIQTFIDEACSGKAGRRHNAVDFLLLMDPEEAAYLTVRTMVNYCIVRTSVQATAISLMDAIIDALEFRSFREQNRVGYKGYMKQQAARGYSRQRRSAVQKLFENEGVAMNVSKAMKTTAGLKLMELAADATGLFVIDTEARARKKVYTLRPTETLRYWMEKQHDRCSVMEPVNMPMLCRPRRWRSPTYGGYLTRRPGNRFVKQRNAAYHEELKSMDIDVCYDAVNHIQDTPWAINGDVLDVMDTVWREGGTLGGLPQREDDPVPPKPFDIDTNEEAKLRWKREAATIYQRNAERQSSRFAVVQGLWVGRRFRDEEQIFFPHELDFRGRVYPIPNAGPSPQGSDWQKGLLHFAEGKPLGLQGWRWLMIHIANLFGVDKVSFEERVAWVTENTDAILDSGKNPLDGERFWATADSPYCALAACIEFASALDLEDPTQFVSRIPVALDGSCSGLQHFSAMLRDEEGGTTVNLLPSDTPQDVYMKVAAKAQAEADAEPTITYEDKQTGETVTIPNPWMDGKVSRKMAKRPTMTYCYSATRFGMMDMILQTLREIDRENEAKGEAPYLNGADNYQAATWLSHAIYSSIRQTIRSAAVAMDWLRDAAKVASEENMPLWWTTPLGLPILQEYKKLKGKRIDTHWSGSRLQVMLQIEQSEIDSRRQANGVAPNFIHSMDAAHLQAVALGAKREGIKHIAVIHDSFGTHAADTGTLTRVLRETFVEQYSTDILGDFYQQLKEQLGEDLAERLPEPPKPGTMDLAQVLEAEYTFA